MDSNKDNNLQADHESSQKPWE